MDDFQDGTTQGWELPIQNPNPPVVVMDAGPDGAGDDVLQIASDGGNGPGSRLAVLNFAQWTGDYLTEGVTMVELDVNNVGPGTLNIRLALNGDGGTFATTDSFPLGSGTGWQTAAFPLSSADLTAVSDGVCCLGGTDADATLANVTEFRIISAANPAFRGDEITGQLHIDNITALPEPSRAVLLAAGLATLLALKRWRPHPERV